MLDETEELLRSSVERCLRETFGCDLVKRDCVVALKELDWNGYVIDMVAYNSRTQSLYIVEVKNSTSIDTDGIAAGVGEILIDIAGMADKEAVENIRQYAELGERNLANIFFYIALPNFVGGRAERRLHKAGLDLISAVRRIASGWVGLLEVHDLNMPARVVEGLESRFSR